MYMFDYKQRPFSRSISDEEYDRAVGRVISLSPAVVAALDVLTQHTSTTGELIHTCGWLHPDGTPCPQ